MSIILGLLLLISLWRIRIGFFHEDYCAPVPTTAIKGVLAIIILCSHLSGFVGADWFAEKVLRYLGQSMVAPYFFFSGFGIAESLRKKPNYSDHFFKNRFLKTLLHFDLAVLLYVVAAICLQTHYPPQNYLLCWIGWEGLGNSNWFMFVILALYLLVFLAMKTGLKGLTVKMFLLAGILWTALFFGRHASPWWYNTLITFPLGILFSDVKPKLDPFLRRQVIWFSAFLALAILYLGLHHLIGDDRWGLVSSLFCLLIILASMKVRIDNPILTWLGLNAFAIYILQRLPMIVLSHFGLERFPLYFTILIFAITLLTAGGFTKLTGMIDRKLFTAK